MLAKLGLLDGVPACTDLITKPWVQEAGVDVLNQPFFAKGNVATAGGCLASQYLAAWMIARLEGVEAAKSALHYVAPVGEKDEYVARAMRNITPYLRSSLGVQQSRAGLKVQAAQRVCQFPAGIDAQLGEDFAQMPLDGAVAEEQLLADLGVGEAFVSQAGDLRFLRCEGIIRVGGALAHRLAGGQQFALRALGECMRTHLVERRIGSFELAARIDAAMFAAKPLAVDELRAGVVDDDVGTPKLLDRFPVEVLGFFSIGEQRARARLDAARPFGTAEGRAFGQLLER